MPEVETTRRGLDPHLIGRRIAGVEVYERRLRQRVDEAALNALVGQAFRAVSRRAKYLLFRADNGGLVVHLGMSGSLRMVDPNLIGPEAERRKHDLLIWRLDSGLELRYHDPRRFGSVLWIDGDPINHPLLLDLGPEPLSAGFNADHLQQRIKGRNRAIRDLLLDSRLVAGIGNIYANEALFQAGIHPATAGGRLTGADCARLVEKIKQVLASAIEVGGTTLNDYVNPQGEPGYFALSLAVYGRKGEPCRRCQAEVVRTPLGGRSVFYCPNCQGHPKRVRTVKSGPTKE